MTNQYYFWGVRVPLLSEPCLCFLQCKWGLKNVARCFSFVSLNSLKDRFFFPLVSSRTFISLLFARSFPHLGQNLNETCKDSPHVEKSRRKKEELRNRSFFSANTWGPGANVLRRFRDVLRRF